MGKDIFHQWEQGWRSGESTRLPPMTGPGSIPGLGVIRGLTLLLVLVPAPRVFLRVLRFSSLHKNQHFQIPIRPRNSGEKSHPVDSTEIPIYLFLFIYLFIIILIIIIIIINIITFTSVLLA